MIPTDPRPPLSRGAARLDEVFASARREGRAALAAYLPVGYPTVETSVAALRELGRHADVLELGLPFSDPLMDGPAIQRAGAAALAGGFRIRHLLAAVRELAATSPAALLVMTYWQPVARYGPGRLAAGLAEAGAAGVVLPDLPVEEAGAWLAAARAHGLHTVFVVAPNADDARLARICAAGGGMVYAPAVAGVTGASAPPSAGLPAFVARLRTLTSLPVGVGIGVSTPAQAQRVGRFADAVIVGSALVRCLLDAPGPAGVRAAAALAADLAGAVRGAARLPAVPA
jgi:tryptophan synthase alpha chain